MSGVDDQQVIGEQQAAPITKAEAERARASDDFEKQANPKPVMTVKVHSPFRNYFSGQAYSVTAENDTGPFDILPRHHNFISLLNACDMIIRTVTDGEQKIQISGGIMHVKADQVVVFLDV